jgi:hypothetical protein
MVQKIKTASDLKYYHLQARPDSHFFTRRTMRFFGDTMRNYGVRRAGNYWELYRRRPVKGGLRESAWFCVETFHRVHCPVFSKTEYSSPVEEVTT